MTLTSSAALLFAALLSGCAGRVITNNGQTVYEKYWVQAVQSLSGRAQIDLDCQPAAIDYKLISRQGKVPVEVLVEGCSRRALYARPARRRTAWSRVDQPAVALAPTQNIQIQVENNVSTHAGESRNPYGDGD